jgi:hypothetical protein
MQIGLVAAVGAAMTGACGRSEESGSEVGRAGTDTAALAASTPAGLRVSNVMIGKRVGPGNRITEPTFQFAPGETVHVSVATEGTGETATLTAAWRSQSGEILQQSAEPARPGENTAFHLSRPKGLKAGTYKVILFLGDDSVDTKVFAVRK